VSHGGRDDDERSDGPLRRRSVVNSEHDGGREGKMEEGGRDGNPSLGRTSGGEVSASTSAVKRHSSAPVAGSDGPFENVRVLDPDDYVYAKKKLKKAVLEHYR
jgi:hypothetical protein